MTNFRTEFPAFNYPFNISHQMATLCIGSCFAAHMGQRLLKHQFPALINPFGILYNPVSIAQQLQRTLEKDQYRDAELIEHQGLWQHFQFHSQFSGTDRINVLRQINDQLELTHSFLTKSKTLIVTLGTANVFIYKNDQQIVANCHKIPANHFERKLLPTDHCITTLSAVFEKLKKQNAELNIILTVSPIRHIRDGFIENQRSKSTLLLACSEIIQQLDYVYYFPAYEIMMDDLRDYRFYKSDMIHPSEMAIDYIWTHFRNALFSKETSALMERIEKIIQASLHRPFQVASEGHQLFLRRQLEEIKNLKKEFPFLKLEEEQQRITNQFI